MARARSYAVWAAASCSCCCRKRPRKLAGYAPVGLGLHGPQQEALRLLRVPLGTRSAAERSPVEVHAWALPLHEEAVAWQPSRGGETPQGQQGFAPKRWFAQKGQVLHKKDGNLKDTALWSY